MTARNIGTIGTDKGCDWPKGLRYQRLAKSADRMAIGTDSGWTGCKVDTWAMTKMSLRPKPDGWPEFNWAMLAALTLVLD